MNIVTTYFRVKRIARSLLLGADVMLHKELKQQRQMEYLQCLHHNLSNPHVESIHLIVEDEESYKHFLENVLLSANNAQCNQNSGIQFTEAMKSKIIPIWNTSNCLPLYSDLFAHANKLLESKLTMICNADVYILSGTKHRTEHITTTKDKTFTKSKNKVHIDDKGFVQNAQLLFAHSRERQQETLSLLSSSSTTWEEKRRRYDKLALALTRYEDETLMVKPLIDDYRGSHDAFIVEPPVPLEVIEAIAHAQNSYQAENVVLYELKRHGYLVLNPCHDMHLVHNHHVNIRQWLPSVVSDNTVHIGDATSALTAKNMIHASSVRYERASPVSLSDAIRIVDEAFE